MKYKLINKTTGEKHICEKVVIDGWDYYVSDKMPNVGSPFYDKELNCVAWRTDNSLVHKNDVEIIATNNQNIDIPKLVDEVELLANEQFEHLGETTVAKGKIKGYVIGYNKSQETHPNSDSDTAEFAEWLTLNTNSTSIHGEYIYKNVRRVTKELLQLWKEQRTKTLYYET